MQVAIDFTASNGRYRDPTALHYLDDATNQYLLAIRAIGGILQSYDSDQQIPVYGFGGRLPKWDVVSHCFALNGDIFNPSVHGLEEVCTVYKNAVPQSGLSGPTSLAPILKYVNGQYVSKRGKESQ